MKANEYQKQAYELALPQCKSLNYMILGLCNEAGEVAGKYKKYLREDVSEDETREDIAGELGDTLWYLSGAAEQIGYTLENIMDMNMKKILDRKERNVLQGDGDKR